MLTQRVCKCFARFVAKDDVLACKPNLWLWIAKGGNAIVYMLKIVVNATCCEVPFYRRLLATRTYCVRPHFYTLKTEIPELEPLE